jgi:hypothetical protein
MVIGLKKSFAAVQTLLDIGSSNEELLIDSINRVGEVPLYVFILILFYKN